MSAQHSAAGQRVVAMLNTATAAVERLADRLEARNALPPKPPGRVVKWSFWAAVHAFAFGLCGVETSLLWRWFAVPMGLRPLGFWNAIGLVLLVGSVTYAGKPSPAGAYLRGRLQRMATRLAFGAAVAWAMRGAA